MKRIDDKIQEIEKKDKKNRILYISFVLLIGAFMTYVLYSENEKSKLDTTIASHEGTILEGISQRKKTDVELKATNDSLKKSLRPAEYWEFTKKENSVEGYISYITNEWGIDRTAYLSKAIVNLQSKEVIGFQGWLFVGSKKNNGSYQSKDIVEVIRPVDGRDNFKNSEIKIGDIVQLTAARNRKTYRSETSKTPKSQGWRNKTKGFVTAIWKDPKTTDFKIQIKYY
jgi:hypothetical protein